MQDKVFIELTSKEAAHAVMALAIVADETNYTKVKATLNELIDQIMTGIKTQVDKAVIGKILDGINQQVENNIQIQKRAAAADWQEAKRWLDNINWN